MSRRVLGMREALRPQPHLSDEKCAELAVQAKSDPAAREELVVSCLGLVVSEARRARTFLGEDAFSEASIAFLTAIDSFEPAKGSFRGWAVNVMRNHLSDASSKERNYRLRRVSDGDVGLAHADQAAARAEQVQAARKPARLDERLDAVLELFKSPKLRAYHARVFEVGDEAAAEEELGSDATEDQVRRLAQNRKDDRVKRMRAAGLR